MDEKRIRPTVWWSVIAAMSVLAVVVVVLETRRTSQIAMPPKPPAATAPAASPTSAAQPQQAPSHAEAAPAARTPPAAQEPVPYIEGQVFGDIDLREAREVMPDNLYWKFGAPTKDPAVLEAREQEKIRRNNEYGKVLSGDASEEEVRAYYDYRTRLSTDYLEFADFMNRRFRDSLSDEFKGMLDLSIKLHAARLAQIPGDLEAALEHSRAQAKVREEWRRQQDEFNSAETTPPGGQR